jgi:hypothetical protein
MSCLTYFRMTLVSMGIFISGTIAAGSATAAKVAIIDSPAQQLTQQPTTKLGAGLDIGLQPLFPYKSSSNRVALQPGNTDNSRQPLGVGVTARVGTLGIGVDVGKSISPQFSGRLGFNFGSIGINRTDSGIDYNSQLNLSSVHLFGDYFPFNGSSFRVTGGLVAQNNRFAVTGTPSGNGTYTIDGNQYPASAVGSLTGEYKYGNSIAPYLGIGIGKTTNEGLSFNADLGVMFAGSPKVSLNASNPAFNNNPITRSQLDNQVRQTENDLRGFNVYPVLSVGLAYGF